MIEGIFHKYNQHSREELVVRTQLDTQKKLTTLINDKKVYGFSTKYNISGPAPADTRQNPYKGLNREQYWRTAITNINKNNVDPVAGFPYRLSKSMKVATAGSCFAQHIARHLQANGFNYYIAEPASKEMDPKLKAELNYDVFSARYGNIYTSRQLLQLIKAAFDEFTPQDGVWQRDDGRYIDALRPTINPYGYETTEEVLLERAKHLEKVREMIMSMDVFIFTLGLTEYWYSSLDGTAYPVAPGVAGGAMDYELYRFGNLEVEDVVNDMNKAIALIRRRNPEAAVILTVSPVPLAATYERRHVLTSTTYSKSVLRTAADKLRRLHAHTYYFPSYEIITGNFNMGAYYEEDLRNVNAQGVRHVMSLFLRHATRSDEEPDAQSKTPSTPSKPAADKKAEQQERDYKAFAEVVCDDVLLDPGQRQ